MPDARRVGSGSRSHCLILKCLSKSGLLNFHWTESEENKVEEKCWFFLSSGILADEYRLSLNKQEAIFLRVFFKVWGFAALALKQFPFLSWITEGQCLGGIWTPKSFLASLPSVVIFFFSFAWSKFRNSLDFPHFLLLNSCLRYVVKQCRPGSALLRDGANDPGFPMQALGEQN